MMFLRAAMRFCAAMAIPAMILIHGAGWHAAPALALLPEERLADEALEARARALSLQLRCLVCQNQSIDDSDAPFAKDMRRLLRERLTAGDTDAEIIAFLRMRYGDYVLLEPPFNPATALLWVAPFGFLLCGIIGIMVARRIRQ